MTFKDNKGGDYVAGGVWARRGAQVFLLDQVHKHLSFTDTVTAFLALCAKWPQAARKLVEDSANGTAVIDSLTEKIPGIVPVQPRGTKYARANAVAPFVEAGNVHLPSREVALFDVDGYIDECAGFPNAAHDDQVDQTSQALDKLLLDLGPEFTLFAEQKPNPVAEEAGEPLTPIGQFAYRPTADEPDWAEDYEDQARRVVRTVVTAEQ
jgi:predicted phage terminase large subunit-like protein